MRNKNFQASENLEILSLKEFPFQQISVGGLPFRLSLSQYEFALHFLHKLANCHVITYLHIYIFTNVHKCAKHPQHLYQQKKHGHFFLGALELFHRIVDHERHPHAPLEYILDLQRESRITVYASTLATTNNKR